VRILRQGNEKFSRPELGFTREIEENEDKKIKEEEMRSEMLQQVKPGGEVHKVNNDCIDKHNSREQIPCPQGIKVFKDN